MEKPTSGQMKKFWTLIESGHINIQNFQTFLRNPNQGNGGIIEHKLQLGSDVVRRNVKEAEFGYANPAINDDNYPVIGEDVVTVRYRLISGEKLKRTDGWVYRSDVEAYFRNCGMRFPNAAEALLPPAKDKQLGRGGHPMLAFIGGSRAAFFVDENGDERYLGLSINESNCTPNSVFLAVCE